MNKENLALISGFGSNAVLLEGVIEYMNDFFNVDLIELPGFTRDIPPLSDISIPAYVKYVEDHLKNKPYQSYILGGVSIGYLLASQIKDPRCKGIFAIEPFLGSDTLRIDPSIRKLLKMTITGVEKTGLSRLLVDHPALLTPLVAHFMEITANQAEIIMKGTDGETFLKIAQQVLVDAPETTIPQKPHVLLMNPQEKTLNMPYVEERMRQELKDLLVIPVTLDHFPKELSREYFEKHIPRAELEKATQWLKSFN